ncbi:MAG: hypothetical protein ACYCZJ_08440 [Sulfuriferula sp.]
MAAFINSMSGNKNMAAKRRSWLALAILLGTVLTVTAQIASGLLMAWANMHLRAFHVVNGLAAAMFLAGEWLWLLFSPSGRVAAQRIFLLSAQSRHAFGRQVRAPLQQGPLREGLGALVEGIFLALASLVVLFGFLIWQGLGGLLPWHRALALLLALLWLIHFVFTGLDHRPRKKLRKENNP